MEPRPARWQTPKRKRSGGQVLSHFFREGSLISVCTNHRRNAEGMTEGIDVGVCRQCNKGCPKAFRQPQTVSDAAEERRRAAHALLENYLTAVEFGYRQCEAGHNLQTALKNAAGLHEDAE